MIQRIQSLFITISIALSALLLNSPLADILTAEKALTFYTNGVKAGENIALTTVPMLILVITFLALDIVTLIAFKKRILQIRLLTFSMILKLGSYGMGAFYVLQYKSEAGFEFLPKFAMSYPIIGFILALLAIRAIGKDEALIKSLDRIR